MQTQNKNLHFFSSNKTNYAGFWVRFLAHIVDNIIISTITLPFIYYIGDGSLTKRTMFVYLAGLYYYIFLTYRYNTTIGKSILNIKIKSTNNPKITLWQVVLREVFGKFLSSILLFGYIITAFDNKKQSLHDKISNTIVYYTSSKKVTTQKVFFSLLLFFALLIFTSYVQQNIFNFRYSLNELGF